MSALMEKMHIILNTKGDNLAPEKLFWEKTTNSYAVFSLAREYARQEIKITKLMYEHALRGALYSEEGLAEQREERKVRAHLDVDLDEAIRRYQRDG